MKVLFILLFILGCDARNHTTSNIKASGKVVKIVDGDTFDILLDNHTTMRIRMEGIDAPERGMAFYQVAKSYLGELCLDQIIQIEETNIDRYGRVIAKSYIGNRSELGLLMIEAGYAWHFKRYSSDMQLAQAENTARDKKVGLWVDRMPVAPWDWRENLKSKNERRK